MDAPEILVTGETLVDFIPNEPGPLSAVDGFSRRAGGAPANLAIALSRLDTTPFFLSRLSTDPFGEFLATTLAENGVSDQFITRDESRKTTLAFVSHDADADRSFTFYRENTADTRLDEQEVGDETLATLSWVYVGGVLLSTAPARAASFSLVERAREQGCEVVFDPNYRPELWVNDSEFAETVTSMLELSDVVKATPDDFAATDFFDSDPITLAQNVLSNGPHTVFLTLGAAGACMVATEESPWGATELTQPGYAVEPVDTTGAGDAFTAGVITKLVDGEPSPEEILAFGNAVAAVTTTESGAITALPSREAVRAFRNAQR